MRVIAVDNNHETDVQGSGDEAGSAAAWTSTETRVIWHDKGGKGQVPQMVHA